MKFYMCLYSFHNRTLKHLTENTFLVSRSKYGNKVLKTIVKHRTFTVYKWWKRNRPGQDVSGIIMVSKLMESTAGIQAIKEMISQKTQVEVIEGDGYNTVISRIETEMGVKIKKKIDHNHCVKNIVKRLYDLRNSKKAKISNQVIQHFTKCINYIKTNGEYCWNTSNKRDDITEDASRSY